MIFMIGDGVETNILAPYLTGDHGFSIPLAGTLVTIYGVAVAIAAFLSASLSDLWGPRKVMMIGAAIWIVFELLFLGVALNTSSMPLIFIAYGLRGFGYPFFAYGFLVWISATANAKRLAVAIGWFYVAFSAGLPTLGALTANATLEIFSLSYYQTLWVSLALVVIGAAIALIGVKEKTGRAPLVSNPEQVFQTMSFGLRLLISNRKALMVMLTRTINSVPTYGMAIFFPAQQTTNGLIAFVHGHGVAGTRQLLCGCQPCWARTYDRHAVVGVACWWLWDKVAGIHQVPSQFGFHLLDGDGRLIDAQHAG